MTWEAIIATDSTKFSSTLYQTNKRLNSRGITPAFWRLLISQMQRDVIRSCDSNGSGDVGKAVLGTCIVVAADSDAIAVDRWSNKTSAGGSTGYTWRAAVRARVATAGNLLNDRGWARWRWWRWWWVTARNGDGTDNSNSEEGNDLSELHLDREINFIDLFIKS